MASSLCPLPGGLLGGRPNELSSYSPPLPRLFIFPSQTTKPQRPGRGPSSPLQLGWVFQSPFL